MKKHFLGVGVNYKKGNSEKLQGCEYDIDRWESILRSTYNFLPENCKKLKTRNAGVSEVKTSFKTFLKNIDDGDLAVFIYSGHGFSIGEKDLQGITCYDEYITDDEIRVILNKYMSDKPLAKIILIFDSCFSASITDSILPYEPIFKQPYQRVPNTKAIRLSEEDIKALTTEKFRIRASQELYQNSFNLAQKENKGFREIIQSPQYYFQGSYLNELLISACGHNQGAVEDQIDQNQWTGVLTHFAIKIMKSYPNINFNQFMDKLYLSINNDGYSQVPRITATDALKQSKFF